MKGLLVKDFRLIKAQKKFFLTTIAMAVIISVSMDMAIFMLSYLTLVMAFFTLSTIGSDEFDNGYAFLFTLPISRREYITEKYVLGILLGSGAWLFSTLLTVVICLVKNGIVFPEIRISALVTLPIMLVAQALCIPFQLRFGGERGKIAIITTMCLLFAGGYAASKIAAWLGFDLGMIFDELFTLHSGIAFAVAFFTAVALLLISARVSLSIMEKKEL